MAQSSFFNMNFYETEPLWKHLSLKRFTSQPDIFLLPMPVLFHNLNGSEPEDQNIIVIIIKY